MAVGGLGYLWMDDGSRSEFRSDGSGFRSDGSTPPDQIFVAEEMKMFQIFSVLAATLKVSKHKVHKQQTNIQTFVHFCLDKSPENTVLVCLTPQNCSSVVAHNFINMYFNNYDAFKGFISFIIDSFQGQIRLFSFEVR